ncbi:MAG: oligosaccharide flippase family protein [Candidatus Pacebacteria bacterium]|nr:oligosaccharide flippase family protein [Candidatus Paceibacterota bacterium]
MGYARKAISGFSWQTGLKFVIYTLSLVKIYFLARLLDPADFGLFSLAAITLGISEALTETGVNLTILQSKHSVKYFVDTAWVIAIFRGVMIGILMLLGGLILSKYFNQPELMMLTAVAALIPVVKGFINPYIVILHKEMRFFQDTMYRLATLIIEIVSSIILGFALHNAYALVLGLLAGGLFEVLLSLVVFRTRPRFLYKASRAKPILTNAKFLSLSNLFNYLSEHIDDFLIGRLTGTHDLGIYHNAYSLTHKVNYQISKSVHHGIIPALTKIKDNLERLRRGFYKSFGATLLIVSLASLPIFVFPELIINYLLGPDWLTAIPLIRPLLLAGIIQSLTAVCYTLFLSIKKYKLLNLHLFVSLIALVGLISWFGQANGLQGAVTGLLISRLISAPVAIGFAFYFLKDETS